MNGGRVSEGSGGSGTMEEIRQIRGGEVVDGLKVNRRILNSVTVQTLHPKLA